MQVGAMVLVGASSERQARFGGPAETIGGVPIALLDVLGRSMVQRLLERLHDSRIVTATTIIADITSEARRFLPASLPRQVTWIEAAGPQLWKAAENCFTEAAHAGVELVLIFRLGPYMELELEPLLQFHLDRASRVTAVVDTNGTPVDTFVASASRRNDVAYLLRHQLRESRTPCHTFPLRGYFNPLADAADLRRLAIDGFTSRAQITPAGRQVRSGLWVEEGARIQRGARIVAPAFIGRRAKVGSAAVVTRYSALEHHGKVDCGTVLEDTTLLPYTHVGPGLDVCHAVVGLNRLFHLVHEVEVEIRDAHLVDTISSSAPLRILSSLASLTTFLPAQFCRSVFEALRPKSGLAAMPDHLIKPPELEELTGAGAPISAEVAPARLGLVVSRRSEK